MRTPARPRKPKRTFRRCSAQTQKKKMIPAEPRSVRGTSERVGATRARNYFRRRWQETRVSCGTTCAPLKPTWVCPRVDSFITPKQEVGLRRGLHGRSPRSELLQLTKKPR